MAHDIRPAKSKNWKERKDEKSRVRSERKKHQSRRRARKITRR